MFQLLSGLFSSILASRKLLTTRDLHHHRSGFQSPSQVRTVAEAAALFLGHRALSPGSGLLLAVPIPAENSADGREIEAAIQVS